MTFARRPGGVLRRAVFASLSACVALTCAFVDTAHSADAAPSAALAAPLVRAPLDPPLVLTGNFGESRSGRYHAGLDFSIGGAPGRVVYAPLDGFVERVRASGSGYGRSIYLRADDGRTLVFAHLDAFAEPLAAYVNDAQEASGLYEQDLWPEANQFRVRAGDRIAWAGASGAGPPHLHFEVREGDVALNPVRAGLGIADRFTPALRQLTLEPLDGSSWVMRSPGPHTLSLDGAADTLTVEGRVRAIVDARDRAAPGRYRIAPWTTALEWNGKRIACVFDRATHGDMAEADLVYDRGRSASGNGVVLWNPARFRPGVLVGRGAPGAAPSKGNGAWNGVIEVSPGDPARPLELEAIDAAGNTARKTVWLRGPVKDEIGPDTLEAGGPPTALRPEDGWTFTMLPEPYVRLEYRGAPNGSRGVTLHGSPAVWRKGRWVAVAMFLRDPPRAAQMDSLIAADPLAMVPVTNLLAAAGRDGTGEAWQHLSEFTIQGDDSRRFSFAPATDFELWSSADAMFEPAPFFEQRLAFPDGTSELVPLAGAWRVRPEELPLRGAVELSVKLPETSLTGRAAIYRASGGGWERVGGVVRDGRIASRAGALGTFAVFADTLAPRIGTLKPFVRSKSVYSTWALEARIVEMGSGVDPAASTFIVDGRRVPTEWDAEARRLRWRPLKPPARGTHTYEVVAADLAGNVRRLAARFVLD